MGTSAIRCKRQVLAMMYEHFLWAALLGGANEQPSTLTAPHSSTEAAMHNAARLSPKLVMRAVKESTALKHLAAKKTRDFTITSKFVQDKLIPLMKLMGLTRQQHCHVDCIVNSRVQISMLMIPMDASQALPPLVELMKLQHPVRTSLLPAWFLPSRCRVKHCKVLHTFGLFSVVVPRTLSLPCRWS